MKLLNDLHLQTNDSQYNHACEYLKKGIRSYTVENKKINVSVRLILVYDLLHDIGEAVWMLLCGLVHH